MLCPTSKGTNTCAVCVRLTSLNRVTKSPAGYLLPDITILLPSPYLAGHGEGELEGRRGIANHTSRRPAELRWPQWRRRRRDGWGAAAVAGAVVAGHACQREGRVHGQCEGHVERAAGGRLARAMPGKLELDDPLAGRCTRPTRCARWEEKEHSNPRRPSDPFPSLNPASAGGRGGHHWDGVGPLVGPSCATMPSTDPWGPPRGAMRSLGAAGRRLRSWRRHRVLRMVRMPRCWCGRRRRRGGRGGAGAAVG